MALITFSRKIQILWEELGSEFQECTDDFEQLLSGDDVLPSFSGQAVKDACISELYGVDDEEVVVKCEFEMSDSMVEKVLGLTGDELVDFCKTNFKWSMYKDQRPEYLDDSSNSWIEFEFGSGKRVDTPVFLEAL